MDAADIVENMNAHLLIIVPALALGTYHIEVSPQFSKNQPLKEPRTTVFDRLLTVD